MKIERNLYYTSCSICWKKCISSSVDGLCWCVCVCACAFSPAFCCLFACHSYMHRLRELHTFLNDKPNVTISSMFHSYNNNTIAMLDIHIEKIRSVLPNTHTHTFRNTSSTKYLMECSDKRDTANKSTSRKKIETHSHWAVLMWIEIGFFFLLIFPPLPLFPLPVQHFVKFFCGLLFVTTLDLS